MLHGIDGNLTVVIFERGQRVVFIGDSITDCGRRDIDAPYGNGYVSLVRAFVTARYPELGLEWTNRGVGGDTVRDLEARWDADAIAPAPHWLSVMIGINDVWRAFDGSPTHAVPLAEYDRTLRDLLGRVVAATDCQLILATPYLIEPDRDEPQRKMSDRYGAVVRSIALETHAVFVDTQAAFDRVLISTPSGAWADDRVHPNLAGHAVLAQAFLRALGGVASP
jgi:lysophospholipase L1-like esterase